MATISPDDKPAAPLTAGWVARRDRATPQRGSLPIILASVAVFHGLKESDWGAIPASSRVWLVLLAVGALIAAVLVVALLDALRPRVAAGAPMVARKVDPMPQYAEFNPQPNEADACPRGKTMIAMSDFTTSGVPATAAAAAHAQRSAALVAVARVSMESAIAACDGSGLHDSLAVLTDRALEALREAMSVDPQETWTFTLCRFDGASGRFRPVVARGAGVVGDPSRDWQGAEAMVRQTCRMRDELRVDDIESLPWLWLEPTGKGPDAPPRTCRSLAVFRVEQGPGRPDWGVVVATSSRPGRFDSEPETAGWDHAEAVRLFTLAAALVVRACPDDGDQGPGEPTLLPAPVRPSGPPEDSVAARMPAPRVRCGSVMPRWEMMACA